jgi:peptidyl-prolyl cis-trans isomerase D
MLQKIRERVQGVVASVIVFFLALTFALFGIERFASNSQTKNELARVNGQVITKQQLSGAMQAQQNYLNSDATARQWLSHPEALRAMKVYLLHRLVGLALYQQAVSKMPLYISDQQIQKQLSLMPEFQSDGVFSQAMYDHALQKYMMTSEEFLARLESQMRESQFLEGITRSAFVLPDEVRQMARYSFQRRDVGYFLLNKATYLPKHIAAQAIQSYYQKHVDQFAIPERLKIRYVLLRMADLKKRILVTDAEVRQYYTDHLDKFTTPARIKYTLLKYTMPNNASEAQWQQADELMQRLTQQWRQQKNASLEKFLAVQKAKLSVQAAGWVTSKDLPVYAQHMMTAQPGRVTDPVRVDNDVVVMRVDARQAKQQATFDQVATRIRANLQNHRARSKYAQMVDQLADLAYTHPDGLQMVSRALKLKEYQSGWLIAGDKKAQRLDARTMVTPAIMKAAFSTDVLQAGNNSAVIQLSDDAVMVLRVDAHRSAERRPLDAQVRDDIRKVLAHKQATQRMHAVAKVLSSGLQRGLSASQLSRQNSVVWRVRRGVTQQHAVHIEPALMHAIFALKGNPIKQHIVNTSSLGPDRLVIMQLLAIQPGRVNDKQLRDWALRLKRLHADLSVATVLAPAIDSAKIKVSL